MYVNIFKHLLLEATGPIEAKFHVKPPWDKGMQDCSNCPGHMPKMAAMSIYNKNLKNLLHMNQRRMALKLGMQHRELEYYQVYPNYNPGLTLTYFKTSPNLLPYTFVWKKGKTMDFSETIVVYDIKVSMSS